MHYLIPIYPCKVEAFEGMDFLFPRDHLGIGCHHAVVAGYHKFGLLFQSSQIHKSQNRGTKQPN